MNPLFGDPISKQKLTVHQNKARRIRRQIQKEVLTNLEKAKRCEGNAPTETEKTDWNEKFYQDRKKEWAFEQQRSIRALTTNARWREQVFSFEMMPNRRVQNNNEGLIDYEFEAFDPDYFYVFAKESWPHRENGPAVVTDLETRHYKNGMLHNDSGRAVKTYKETAWYIEGMLHNLDGPARVLLEDGLLIQEYYQGGVLHRENGPAVVAWKHQTSKLVYAEWCLDGKLHREDGPARIGSAAEFFFENEYYELDDYLDQVVQRRLEDS